MPRCPNCQVEFSKGESFCPRDGSPLSVAAPGADPLAGRVLGGRYRLTNRLGQGGMGTVYRAVHTLMDKPLAVKILRGELSTDAEAVARFHREARSASRLDHEHCIRVTDFGQSEDRLLYLAMELLEGRSLSQRMKDGPIPVPEATAIAYAIALALEHAHEAGVVHRDLKPDNVFLARRPRGKEIVKVLDFGLAKLASDSGQSRSITRDGTIFGTPEYMAPEQAQGEPLDARTDLYALGVLLYHMLTGELPFKGDTFVALLTKHVRETPRPPSELEPSLPPALDALVLACMEKKASDRPPTATALAEALLPFAARTDSTGPNSMVTARDQSSGPILTTGAASAAGAGPSILGTTQSERFDSEALAAIGAGGSSRRLVAVAVILVAVGGFFAVRAYRLRPPLALAGPPTMPAELLDVGKLVAGGKLDEAAAQLEVLHRQGESAALERMTGEVAERRGRRLDALAHLHRAKTLAPTDASVRVALAGLLMRLHQNVDACRQASRAVELATQRNDAATIGLARGILTGAACPAP